MIGEGGMGTAARLTEAGNLTLAGGALKFDLAPSGASDLADVNNLSLGAAAIAINMPAGSLSNGSYDLINYSGSLSGSASTLMLSGAGQRPGPAVIHAGYLGFLGGQFAAAGRRLSREPRLDRLAKRHVGHQQLELEQQRRGRQVLQQRLGDL